MSLIKQAQLENFKNSGAIQTTLAAINNATDIASTFLAVTKKLENIAASLAADVFMLGQYDEQGHIASMEELVGVINAKLEVFDDVKLLVKVEDLAKILKVKKEKAASTKEDVAKAMGL